MKLCSFHRTVHDTIFEMIFLKKGAVINMTDEELKKFLIEEFREKAIPDGSLVSCYKNFGLYKFFDENLMKVLNLQIPVDAKMPDAVFYSRLDHQLYIVDTPLGRGPIDFKRYEELQNLFGMSSATLLFITAIPNRSFFTDYAENIAWGTSVWLADNPTRMVRFSA